MPGPRISCVRLVAGKGQRVLREVKERKREIRRESLDVRDGVQLKASSRRDVE